MRERKPNRPWSSGDDEVLADNRLSDRQAALVLGRDPDEIFVRRYRLGLWDPERPGAEFGRRLLDGRPRRTMAPRRPWTAEEEALLGTMTDTRVAAEIGRLPAAVRYRRLVLGIEAFGQRGRRGRWDDSDIRDTLARMTNGQAAIHYGLSAERMRQLRAKFHVPEPPKIRRV